MDAWIDVWRSKRELIDGSTDRSNDRSVDGFRPSTCLVERKKKKETIEHLMMRASDNTRFAVAGDRPRKLLFISICCSVK